MRSLVPIAALTLALAAGAHVAAATGAAPAERAGTAATSLRITAWPSGRGGASRVWSLRCAPAGGTLPRPGAACRRLAQLDRPFAPVPPGTACTQIFGGPQEALVRGTYRGRKIWARFNRQNGCEIARWNQHSFLFPIRVGAS